MKRPSEITRDRSRQSGGDQYHFKTKNGLYREVLRDAIHALTEDQLSHAQETQAMPRERALGEFVQ
jgi:hypothetical protein